MSQHALQESSPTRIDVLPPALLRAIMLRLPCDARARAACVSRSWRDAVADPALWLRLDLSDESGVTCRVDDAALLAAAARAQGRLEVLKVNQELHEYSVSQAAVHDVAAANAVTLRELRGMRFNTAGEGFAELQELLLAAPALVALEASMSCTCDYGIILLRNEPPFGPLRMHSMLVHLDHDSDEDEFRLMAAELIKHRSLTELCVGVDDLTELLTDELSLVVDAALAVGYHTLELSDAELTPEAAPALARLLSSPALTNLRILNDNGFFPLLDAPGYALLGDALRSNCTLHKLTLSGVIWVDVATEVPALFDALTGHVSLRSLDFRQSYLGAAMVDNPFEENPLRYEELTEQQLIELEAGIAVFGHALGRLVAADAPALKKLKVTFRGPVAGVLGPLIDALPHNTHLQKLKSWRGNLGADFEERLLPAVRTNTSLRKLRLYPSAAANFAGRDAAVDEAVQLVDLREAARVAAAAAAGNA